MTEAKSTKALRDYYSEVKRIHATGIATEHSYRPALQELIENLVGGNVRVINEPARVDCGAPDFIIEENGIPIGHIECKNIGANLDRTENEEQLERYRGGLPNLILTDYLEFRWYVVGERQEPKARLANIDSKKGIVIDMAGATWVGTLLNSFLKAELPSVGSPRELAERMAAKALLLRDCIRHILKQEGPSGSFHELLNSYRAVLISDLSPERFADLQAQTATYGMFAARCLHSGRESFTRQSAVFAETTPFLRNVLGHIAGPEADSRIAWIMDDLALLLNRAEMTTILSDFGKRAGREDPVWYFYENFLANYDRELRERRGVYYTPEPVVSYIVRSADRLLRDRFELPDGLADKSKVTVKEGESEEKKEVHKVLILDPACGTGTFLREVISVVRSTIKEKRMPGAWSTYVDDHLLDRLFGFELLMAPYTVCHLKLALEIGGGNSGFKVRKGKRLNVFLTNTLEKAHQQIDAPLFAREIAREATGADAVKSEKPVMVILGNPPYSGHSANKGEWIKWLLRGRDGELGTDNYFEVDGEGLGESNPKWLNDDYVKFIRFAQWRIARTGEGILGYVTNHSYLDNPTFRGMRQSLMRTFDEIYLLDLHGNAKKREKTPDGGKDENVFDIQQGVAVGLFVKHRRGNDDETRVFHANLWGRRDTDLDIGKYDWLVANDIETTEWTELEPKSPYYFFVPRNHKLDQEYEKGKKLTEIFPVSSVGITTARDKLAVQFTAKDMENVVSDFLKLSVEEARSYYNLGKDTRDWKVSLAQQDLRTHPDPETHITQVLYRPFDTRYTYYTGRSRGFICMPRPDVMHHMRAGPNMALCVGRAGQVVGSSLWDIAFVSEYPSDLNLFRRGGNCLFPLYLYTEEESGELIEMRQPNIQRNFIDKFASDVGLDFVSLGAGDLTATFGSEDIFHYVYALLYSPEYRRRYADSLKYDFPRIPFTGSRLLFAELVKLGRDLALLHMMKAETDNILSFPHSGDDRFITVEYIRYISPDGGEKGRVWINDKQYFEGVEQDVWDFTIGGYRPVEKWLEKREGRTLSFEDVEYYGRICSVLKKTLGVMSKIDETINTHGGWPLT